jgi:outer membrane lipoprotein SlyB
MKIVTGLFTYEEAVETIGYLTDNGFSYDDLSAIVNSSDLPLYLKGDSEESAARGALAGAAAGSSLAALGTWASSTIPGFESMVMAGLMTTAVGGTVGAYLGSLYNTRAENETEMNIHEALETGKLLLLVQANEYEGRAEAAASLMAMGDHVEVHTIPTEEVKAEH